MREDGEKLQQEEEKGTSLEKRIKFDVVRDYERRWVGDTKEGFIITRLRCIIRWFTRGEKVPSCYAELDLAHIRWGRGGGLPDTSKKKNRTIYKTMQKIAPTPFCLVFVLFLLTHVWPAFEKKNKKTTRLDFQAYKRNKLTKNIVTFMWYSNNMLNYMFKAEFVTLYACKLKSSVKKAILFQAVFGKAWHL